MANIKGIFTNFKENTTSGFLVFLIALPLCMGISIASGFPATAGILTAVVGGIITSFISNSELTIKGPAAGLIVIVLGCMMEFGFTGGKSLAADFEAYRLTLGVAIAAGLIQTTLGKLRLGSLGELFPSAAVHGMLAAIGIIIAAKQIPVVLGEGAKGSPLSIIASIPNYIMNANPGIALIGILSLAVMFAYPVLKNSKSKLAILSKVPAQIIVVAIAVLLCFALDIFHPHNYWFLGHSYEFGSDALVPIPTSLSDMIVFPKFGALASAAGWKWVLMFTFIGSLESLLSAKAIDLVDPKKRSTDLNKDLMAVGIANVFAAAIGGLPMISEIVRSKANIDNGAKGRLSNIMHGVFLALAVIFLGEALHYIPMAALAAMLVYTGFRLAHPSEFFHMYKIGKEQFVIFSVTIVATLATDLLIGIGVGVLVKIVMHLARGVKFSEIFKPQITAVETKNQSLEVTPDGAIIFTHWLSLREKIERNGLESQRNTVVDLKNVSFIDHTILSKLEEYKVSFQHKDLTLDIEGLSSMNPTSSHPLSAHRRKKERGVQIAASDEGPRF